MAHGACNGCGCAIEQCECPSTGNCSYCFGRCYCDPDSNTTARGTMPPKITEFECHATYIRDYGFEMVKKLGLQEAFDLLTASPYIDRTMKPKSWTPHPREISVGHEPEAYFLFNKGWSVVEVDRQKGIVRAVYNADGRYGLWQTSMHDFLKRIAQSRSWHTAFGKLYDELAQPHENA